MFDRSSFVCTSKAHDLICIRMSLEVLLKSLKSGSSHGVERVGMALRHRPLKASLEGSAAVPLVEVWWKNECITTSQEIPIERPCAAAEVERICGLCQGSDVPCDFYVDILPELKPIMVRLYFGTIWLVDCFLFVQHKKYIYIYIVGNTGMCQKHEQMCHDVCDHGR